MLNRNLYKKVCLCQAIDTLSVKEQEEYLKICQKEIGCENSSQLLDKLLFSNNGCFNNSQIQSLQSNDIIQSCTQITSQTNSLLQSMPDDVMYTIGKFLCDNETMIFGCCCQEFYKHTQKINWLKFRHDRTLTLNYKTMKYIVDNASQEINLHRWSFVTNLVVDFDFKQFCIQHCCWNHRWEEFAESVSNKFFQNFSDLHCKLLNTLMDMEFMQSVIKSVTKIHFKNHGMISLAEWPIDILFNNNSLLEKIVIDEPYNYGQLEDFQNNFYNKNISLLQSDSHNDKYKKINTIEYQRTEMNMYSERYDLINFGKRYKHLKVGLGEAHDSYSVLIDKYNHKCFNDSIDTITMQHSCPITDLDSNEYSMALDIKTLNLINGNFDNINETLNNSTTISFLNFDKSLQNIFIHLKDHCLENVERLKILLINLLTRKYCTKLAELIFLIEMNHHDDCDCDTFESFCTDMINMIFDVLVQHIQILQEKRFDNLIIGLKMEPLQYVFDYQQSLLSINIKQLNNIKNECLSKLNLLKVYQTLHDQNKTMSSLLTRIKFGLAKSTWNINQCDEALRLWQEKNKCAKAGQFCKKLLFTTNENSNDEILLSIIEHIGHNHQRARNSNHLLYLDKNILRYIAYYFMDNQDSQNYSQCNRLLYIETATVPFYHLILNNKMVGLLSHGTNINLTRYCSPRRLIIDMDCCEYFRNVGMNDDWLDHGHLPRYWEYFNKQINNSDLMPSLYEKVEILDLKHDGLYFFVQIPINLLFGQNSSLKRINIDIVNTHIMPDVFEDEIYDKMGDFERNLDNFIVNATKPIDMLQCVQYRCAAAASNSNSWQSGYMLNIGKCVKTLIIANYNRNIPLIKSHWAVVDLLFEGIENITMINTIPLCDYTDVCNLNIKSLNLFGCTIVDVHDMLNCESNVKCININNTLTNVFVEWTQDFETDHLSLFKSLLIHLLSKKHLKKLQQIIILINMCKYPNLHNLFQIMDIIFNNTSLFENIIFDRFSIGIKYLDHDDKDNIVTLFANWEQQTDYTTIKTKWQNMLNHHTPKLIQDIDGHYDRIWDLHHSLCMK